MAEWDVYKFSDFVEINPQVALPANESISFVEMKDLNESRKHCFPSTEKPKGGGSRFQNGDTLFARITPCLENGKICQVKGLKNNVGFGSTEFLVFRGKKGISDNDFVYYLSRWEEVRAHAETNMEGSSGRQRVSKECFNDLVITLPPLDEQKRIARVLSSLDDKIDLLNRENATLEALAETFFRHHFIENPDPTWKEGKLESVVEVFDSRRKPLSKMERDKMKKGAILYPYYGAAEIMDYIDDYLFDGEFILLGEDGTVRTDDGYPILQFATGKFWPNNHAHVLQAKKPFDNCFLWYYFKTTNIDEIVTGAVQPKINQANLMSLPIYDYPIDQVEEFQIKAVPIWNKIKYNQQQIKTLAAQRDVLLPRLMSGEVAVEVQ